MLILHDPDTLLHKSKEILGSKLIDALECPERIEAIVNCIKEDGRYELYVVGKEGKMCEKVRDLLGICLAGSHDERFVYSLLGRRGSCEDC